LDHYALLLASPVILDSNFAKQQTPSQMAVPALFWTAVIYIIYNILAG